MRARKASKQQSKLGQGHRSAILLASTLLSRPLENPLLQMHRCNRLTTADLLDQPFRRQEPTQTCKCAGKRERSPKRKNYAVGQSQLGNATQVSLAESAMAKPHHGGPVFMITRILPAR